MLLPCGIIVTYMPQFFKQLFGILMLVIFGTSCGCVTLTGLNDFKNAPRDSFVKIEVITTTYFSAGSGVIISHSDNSNTFILTAGHICNDNTVAMRVLDLFENKYDVITFVRTAEDDLCVLVIDGYINGKEMKMSETAPEIGEHIYNIAAPRAIHAPNMSLMFDGYYQGQVAIENEKNLLSIYNLPGTGGSSGSPIFNENWEIIGVVSRGVDEFQHVMIAVSQERTKIFYDYILSDQFTVDLKQQQDESRKAFIDYINQIMGTEIN